MNDIQELELVDKLTFHKCTKIAPLYPMGKFVLRHEIDNRYKNNRYDNRYILRYPYLRFMHPQGSRVGNTSKMAEPTEHETVF